VCMCRATSQTRSRGVPHLACIDERETSAADTATLEARGPAMSLVDRHAMGMLSSVMRALKHMEAIAVAMRPVVQPTAVQQASPAATPRTRRTVSPGASVRGISGFGPLF
jgi:hypothetical protein